MPSPRPDLRDATLRDQGDRLVRQDGAAASVSAEWLACVPSLVEKATGAAVLARFAPFLKLTRDDIKKIIAPARERCERILEEALRAEISETDRATREILRSGLPTPVFESITEGDEPEPPSYERRARTVDETGVRLGRPVLDEEDVRRIAFEPFEGATWPTRFKRLERQAARTVLGLVSRASSSGWSTDRLAGEVAAAAGANEYDARRIARTELQRVANTAKRRCFEAFSDVIAAEEWQAAWEGTCPECGALDGRRFKLGTAPALPVHPHCACTLSPVPRTWRELGIDLDEVPVPGRTLAGYKKRPAGETWRTWIRTQPAAYRKRILGPGRYALLKSGKVTIDQLRAPGGGVRKVSDLLALASAR